MAEEQIVAGVEQGQLHNQPSATTETSPAELSNMADVTSSSPSGPSAPSTIHAHPNPVSSSAPPTGVLDASANPVIPAPGQLQRQPTEALGPASDSPTAVTAAAATSSSGPTATGPFLGISLMLTTGARHPYRIDEKYLRSRKVEARKAHGHGDFDPRELSGYQLKELIWIDWRSEWEPRPTSPSSIRLIIMGRMIEDKAALKDFPFSLDAPNVVHMTVKPADLIDDDETAAKGTGKAGAMRGRDGEDQGAGCRCVIL